jgi:translation initiation factor 2B subunit (eIF-2B alpha/beta/delta family)
MPADNLKDSIKHVIEEDRESAVPANQLKALVNLVHKGRDEMTGLTQKEEEFEKAYQKLAARIIRAKEMGRGDRAKQMIHEAIEAGVDSKMLKELVKRLAKK